MTKLRIAATLGMVAGLTLAPGATAIASADSGPVTPQATVSLLCSEGSYYYYTCHVTTSFTPQAISWFREGRHLSNFDNLRTIAGGCYDGERVTSSVKVTAPDGTVYRQTHPVSCHGNG